jgi:23S rRNA pseudouridine1911/1915/1917 synthase
MARDYSVAPLSAEVPAALAGLRLDQALAKIFPQYSRSRLTAWLEDGRVRLRRGALEVASQRRTTVLGGERVELSPPDAIDAGGPHAQRMKLAVVHEDRDLIVLNKPAGHIVHPGAGNPDKTLMNALLAHAPALRALPRAGIVHRLDKDTSGLMVVAKTLEAQTGLVRQLAARSVKRTYLALVHGEPPEHGAVDAPVGRDSRSRTRMTVTNRGKEARTNFRVVERFEKAALVECRLETGRTHQIRVHLQHIKHPVIGDPVYNKGAKRVKVGGIEFPRQALHAAELELEHPKTGKTVRWKAPLPADMKKLLAELRGG